jgi:magnesium transporter
LISIFLHRDGKVAAPTSIERNWISAPHGAFLWVDLPSPSIPDGLILSDTFAFHKLAVEDAMTAPPGGHLPKLEAYDGYFFAIFHGVDSDVGAFVGPHYLVTVHRRDSKTVADLMESLRHGPVAMSEGPMALFHRLVDGLVDGCRKESEALVERADKLEQDVFEKASPALVKLGLSLQREVVAFHQTIAAQSEVVERLSRREFVDISTEMSFRFRDVHDHLVRLTFDASALDGRLSGLLAVATGFAGRRWI